MGVILFLTATLAFSILGAVLLLALKRYEMTTGKVVFGQARPKVGAFFNICIIWIEHALPKIFAHATSRSAAEVKKVIHQVVAYGIHSLERALEWVLKTLHYTTHPTSGGKGGEVSSFLREVAEHKKKLLKRSPSRATEEDK